MAMSEIAPGVRRLGSEFVNFYALEAEDGIVLVDAGFPGYADDVRASLTQMGHSIDDVRAVVLTHGDGDHTGLVPMLTEGGAPVYLHPGDRELVANPRPKKTEKGPLGYLRHGHPRRFFLHAIRNGGVRPPKITQFEALEDGQQIPGTGLTAIHTPGHTDGHCVLHHAEKGVLFAGDELCTKNPLTGREGIQIPARGANLDTSQVLGSLDRLEGLEGELVLCGHGEPFRGSPAHAAAGARGAGPS